MQTEGTDAADKVTENRLRRVLARRGWRLRKCPRRDPQAVGYGRYRIEDPFLNAAVAGVGHFGFDMDLDDVEAWMKEAGTNANKPD